MSTTWSVTSMVVQNQSGTYTNVVYIVSWLAQATDGTNTARRGGDTQVPALTVESFVPYEQLVESDVLDWVHDILGADQVAAIGANLDSQLAYLAAPPVAMLPLPWA
jgi:hypothetical protein